MRNSLSRKPNSMQNLSLCILWDTGVDQVRVEFCSLFFLFFFFFLIAFSKSLGLDHWFLVLFCYLHFSKVFLPKPSFTQVTYSYIPWMFLFATCRPLCFSDLVSDPLGNCVLGKGVVGKEEALLCVPMTGKETMKRKW